MFFCSRIYYTTVASGNVCIYGYETKDYFLDKTANYIPLPNLGGTVLTSHINIYHKPERSSASCMAKTQMQFKFRIRIARNAKNSDPEPQTGRRPRVHLVFVRLVQFTCHYVYKRQLPRTAHCYPSCQLPFKF